MPSSRESPIGYGVITTLSRGWVEGANPRCWRHLQLSSGTVPERDARKCPRCRIDNLWQEHHFQLLRHKMPIWHARCPSVARG